MSLDAGILHLLEVLATEPENPEALARLDAAAVPNGKGGAKVDPALLRALGEARRLHRERGDHDLVLRLVEVELAAETDSGKRADLYLEKGRILLDEMWAEADGVKAFQRVLELRPKDESAEEALSHAALVRDNWEKIAKKYLDEAQGSTDRALTTSLYVSAAELYAKHGQATPRVEALLRQALEVEPRNVKASFRLERIYRTGEKWPELAALIEQRIEATASKEDRVLGYLTLAEIQAKRLGHKDIAAETYKKVLGIEPANSRALASLVEHYTVAENWQALIRVYENAQKARPRGDSASSETAMALQIGILWWKKLGNLEAADEAWKRVRKAEPAHPVMLDFYRELYAKDSAKLLPILQQAQKLESDPQRRLGLAAETATLAERAAGGAEKAIDLWKAVWKQDPTRADAGAALRRLYEQTEKWNALLELLKERNEALPKDDVDGRVAGLLEVVAIYRDKLNLDVMVINTYNQVLQLRPDHAVALTALAAKYEALGRWNDLIGVLTRTADVTVDVPVKAALLRRVSSLWLEKFSNVNQAVRPLEELYALAPDDPETVARLRDIYAKRRAWRALLDLERRELDRLPESLPATERRTRLVEVAKLAAERLGDLREGIALWNRVLGFDRLDVEALTALAGLYEREKRLPALVEILKRQIERADIESGDKRGGKLQVQLLERVGTIWAERLSAPEQAIFAWQEIVRRMPTHPKAMRTLQGLYAHLGRFDELERLYGDQGHWEELCDVLLGVSERLAETDRKIAIYQRVAQLAEEKLKSPERAIKAYERTLALEPTHRAAATALQPLYRAQEKWARLMAVQEILLQHAVSDDDKLALLGEIMTVAEQKLNAKGLAFGWAQKAYAIRPADPRLEAELERLASESEAWEELSGTLQAELARETDPVRRVDRHLKLGRVLLARLRRPDEARPHFEAVAAERPDDEEAQSTLEQLFTQTSSFPELLSIYRRREGRTTDPARRLDLLFKIAWIEEEKIADFGAAATTFQKILDLKPAEAVQLRALRGLEKLHGERADWKSLATVIERQLALHDGDAERKLGLLFQLGELEEQRLHDLDAALAHYRMAFALSPGHRPTQTALERWLLPDGEREVKVNPQSRVEVASLLLPVFEQRGESRKVGQCLEILLAATPESDRNRRLELLRRLGTLATGPDVEIGEARRAYGLASRVFQLDPSDAVNRRTLLELADRLETPDDLAVQLGAGEETADKAGDKALAVDLGWELGQLFETRLSMPDDAEAAYKRVLAREPDHGDAEVALSQLYGVRERWADLRALLARKKDRAPSGRDRVAILFQLADLDEGALADEPAAIGDYAEVLDVDPTSVEATRAFRSLDRIYTAKERWKDLDVLLDRRTAYAPQDAKVAGTPDSRAHLKARRAELLVNRLDRHAEALPLLEEAVADEPRHEGARKALENIAKRPELRLRVMRFLEPLYEREEAWPKLALCLGAQREAPENRQGDVAIELSVRLAELQEEKLGARQLALATWREALRLSPGDKRIRQNVGRLSQLLGRIPELAQAWEEALVVSDPADLSLRAEILEDVAELYEYELKDPDKAKQAWRRLLELDPANLSAARPAAAALARLYEVAESWPDLIQILHRQADWAETAVEKKQLLFRIGRIQEDLVIDPKAAVKTYREILDVDGEDTTALESLERLHNAQSQWPELIEVLRRRLDLERGPGRRRDLLWRVAQLEERERKDLGEAVAGYHAVLDENPDDQPALQSLARLYETENRRADLLEIVERQLTIAVGKSTPDRTALRLKTAQLLNDFGRRDQALERFREILDEEPSNQAARAGLEALLDDDDLRLRAAEILEPRYQQAGETEKIVRLCELWAQHAPDPQQRIQRLRRIAELRVGHPEDVFSALARAARFSVGEPELPQLLATLERAAQAANKGAQLVELYRELGPDILDAKTQERVYLQIAVESGKLGDRPTAREYYRRVLDTSPDHPAALDALESIYLQNRELEALFEIYSRRADLAAAADDDETRRRYLIMLASLCEGELARPSEAISAWQQVLESQPNDIDAWKALEGHYIQAERWSDLAELIERRIGFADDLDEAVNLRFRLAQLYADEIGDSERAVENYRATLGGEPNHQGAIAALEGYLDDPIHQVSAAEVLESVYSGRHDWAQLARIQEIRLNASDDPRLQLAMTRRIARMYEEQLEDLEGAFRWYAKVFALEPGDRAIRDQLARLAGILDRWAMLAKVYEDHLADSMDEGPVSVEILRGLGSLHHTRLNNVDGAKAAYLRLLSIDPSDELAFVNLEKVLTGAGRFAELAEVWSNAAESTNDLDRRKSLYFKQAHVRETELDDASAAIELYRGIIELDPDDNKAIAALERLYTSGKRWHDLVELLLRRLERADGPAWLSLKLRLGALYETELSDRVRAIDTYEEALGKAPGNPDAVRALERLIVDQDQTFRIAQILEPIYKTADAWQKLVVIYDAQLDFIDDKARRVDLLREIAKLHEERGGDVRLGFAALARAWTDSVGESNSDVEAELQLYEELARLARSQNMWPDLVKALLAVVEKTYDSELQARIHARVARVREKELADRPGAIESWRKVVNAVDDDLTAWKALESLFMAEQRPAELVDVLEKRATLSNDPTEQLGLLARAAAIYEVPLGRLSDATGTWQRVLTLDDGQPEALDALERLFAKSGAHRDLAQIYSRKIELATSDNARRELYFSLAGVSEKNLNDRQAAIESLRGVLQSQPQDRQALVELVRLYEAEEQWSDVLDMLDQLVALPSLTEADRIGYSFRAADVLEHKLRDPEAAITRYRDVLLATPVAPGAPYHEGALQALERLARSTQTSDDSLAEQVLAVLEPFYLARTDYQPLVELFELRLGQKADPQERRALLLRLAELQEAGLEDVQAAFVAWTRVLADEASDEAAQGELERLAAVGQLWTELARVYEERLAASFDPETQRALACKLGPLYETRLGDDVKAIAAWKKALDLPGEERGVLQALDRLLLRGGRHRELAEILEREAQLGGEPAEQAELWARLGTLRAGELVDLDGALGAFREAIERAPAHPAAREGLSRLIGSRPHAEAALDLLEPLYEDDGEHKRLLELGEVRLGLVSSTAEKVALLERMAERADKQLGDRAIALDAIRRALLLEPSEQRLADEIERLAQELDDPLMAAALFETVLDGTPPTDVARDLGLRSGRLYQRFSDPRAETRFRAVLDVDGENEEALVALEAWYRAVENRTSLAEILGRRAVLAMDNVEKRKLYIEAARLLQAAKEPLANVEAAWRRVLDTEESDADALDALAALYREAGRHHDLVTILDERARFAEGPAQAALKTEIAKLYGGPLDELDKAASSWRDLLDVLRQDDPGMLPALAALLDVERRRGDFNAVQEVLVRRLQAVGPGEPQIPVYLELAELAVDKLRSPEDAIGYLHEVLALRPTHPDAVDQLVQLLDDTGKHHDLVDVLTSQANLRAQVGDTESELSLLVRAADIWEGRLGSPESATEILERILERDPKNVRALTSLARIYEGARDLERCRSTLERAMALAESAGNRDDQAELAFRLGSLEEELNSDDTSQAEAWYRRALELKPGHTAAEEKLVGFARAGNRSAEVAALLAGRANRPEHQANVELLVEIAKLYGDRPADALPYLERALALKPDDAAVQEPLADLYASQGRLDDALPVYRALADRMQKARRMKDVGRLRARIAGIAESRGDAKLALDEYLAAHQIDPAHAQTMAALSRLYMADSQWEKARGILRKMLLQNLDPTSGVTKGGVYLRLGEIHEKLNEAPKAVGMYERGLELEPQDPALRAALSRLKPR